MVGIECGEVGMVGIVWRGGYVGIGVWVWWVLLSGLLAIMLRYSACCVGNSSDVDPSLERELCYATPFASDASSDLLHQVR